MLNPIVIPFPVALALLGLIGAALYAADRFLRADAWNPWAGQTWASESGGRHRPESIPATVRRDWADAVADRLREQARRESVAVLAARLEVVRERDQPRSMWSWSDTQIAGHDDRTPIEPGPLRVAPVVGCEWHEEGGYGFMWDCPACKRVTVDEATGELATVGA